MMAKNVHAIYAKMNHINKMVIDLRNNQTVKKRIGGYTVQDVNEEIKFQQDRYSVMQWAESHDTKDIIAEIKVTESKLTTDEKSCKYGIVRGLPLETIALISKVELLELAIEEHGKHPGGWE